MVLELISCSVRRPILLVTHELFLVKFFDFMLLFDLYTIFAEKYIVLLYVFGIFLKV